ncbi:MAG: hypothetical protein H7Y27_11845 [Gemmatimonadaceae bacterium]|nr:hypothetical protein [Chitinophagaceae bacterium]
MKNTKGQNTVKNPQTNNHKTRPEIRDNLDSRKNEEQDIKGDDITHNEKPVKNKKPGQSGKD